MAFVGYYLARQPRKQGGLCYRAVSVVYAAHSVKKVGKACGTCGYRLACHCAVVVAVPQCDCAAAFGNIFYKIDGFRALGRHGKTQRKAVFCQGIEIFYITGYNVFLWQDSAFFAAYKRPLDMYADNFGSVLCRIGYGFYPLA